MPNITITVLATYLCRTRLLAVYKIDVVLELMVSQKGDGVYRTWSRSWNWMRGGGAGNSTRSSRFLDPVAEGTARRRYELRMGRRRAYLLRRRRMELTISGIAAAAA